MFHEGFASVNLLPYKKEDLSDFAHNPKLVFLQLLEFCAGWVDLHRLQVPAFVQWEGTCKD